MHVYLEKFPGGSWRADCPWVLPISFLYTFANQVQAPSVSGGGPVVQPWDGLGPLGRPGGDTD